MGTGHSKNNEEESNGRNESLEHGGGQLYVSLKMEKNRLVGELVPHVYGSVPLVGSWDCSKAVVFPGNCSVRFRVLYLLVGLF